MNRKHKNIRTYGAFGRSRNKCMVVDRGKTLGEVGDLGKSNGSDMQT
jgi:hypothetical protein